MGWICKCRFFSFAKLLNWSCPCSICWEQSERRHGQQERCTCPDPALPLANPDKEWKKHHARLVEDAKKAPKILDIVFLGDEVVEQWNGTKNMGTEIVPGMREPFEKRFTKAGGGDSALAGLALGSSIDTVRLIYNHYCTVQPVESYLFTEFHPLCIFLFFLAS